MKILFVRHAEKIEETDKSGLTKKGFKQAKYLAKYLEKIKIDEFYCSEFLRARQTAKRVSKKIKLIPVTEGSLNEYKIKFLKTEFKKVPKEVKKRRVRLKNFLDKIIQDPNIKKTILIISHGITNRIIFSQLMKIKQNLSVPFVQKETGLNEILWNKKHQNWRLVRWNDNSHLPKRLK